MGNQCSSKCDGTNHILVNDGLFNFKTEGYRKMICSCGYAKEGNLKANFVLDGKGKITFKDTIYDFYAGSKVKFYNKYPNDLIPWEVFKWGKENNYKVFDFGGAGKPGVPYGVRDYKLKFGGELVNFGRFEKVNKPLLMKLGKTGLNLYRILK